MQLTRPRTRRNVYQNVNQNLNKPSLEKAWTHFEHVSLYRYIVEEKPIQKKKSWLMRAIRKFQKGDKKLEKAEPGENKDFKTKLYDPIFTPHAHVQEKRTNE